MKLFETRAYCERCGARLELTPAFLSTFPSKVLFVSGAVLLGSTLSDMLTSLGFPEQGVSRPLIDLAIAASYYFTCRLIFFFFQHTEMVSLQRQEDEESQ